MDIIAQIAARPNGDILNIIQAASEMPDSYSTQQKLEAGYAEIVA